jgi:hypothetical protein
MGAVFRLVWFSTLLLVVVGCNGGDAIEASSARDSTAVQTPAPVARVSTTDAWLDLIAQRPSAVVLRAGRVFVDLSNDSSRKHTELAVSSPWVVGSEVDGRTSALVLGRGGSLDVPLDGALAPKLHPDEDMGPDEPPRPRLAMAITLRGLAPKQLMTVLWNERPIVNLRVSEEWERRTISIPYELARPGENQIRLHFRKVGQWGEVAAAAAVESIEVGTREVITQGTVEPLGYSVEPTSAGNVSMKLHGDTGLVYYLTPPRRARLRFDVEGHGSLRVLVSTDEDHRTGRPPTEIHQEPLRETGARSEIDLSGYAGEPTRIEVSVRGTGENTFANFSSLDIIARRNVGIDRRARELRDLYVLAIEGARPDDLLDSNRRPDLPNVHRLAAGSLVFDRAYALGAAAVPSHAGLLSSEVPPVHLTVRGTFVAQGQTMLPEVLARAGYFTIGLSANSDVNEERGLTQGIEDHKVFVRSPTQAHNAEGLISHLLGQLEQRPSPRMAYVTINDPQAPYDPPAEYIPDVEALEVAPEGSPAQHLTHMWVQRVRMGKVEPSAAVLERVRRLYRGELQVVDTALGQLLDTLEQAGKLDDSIIVLVGVHGEEFYEHGGAGHGYTLHEESIHVPLLIHAPALLEPGHVSAAVDLLDLAPTLADLLGIEYPTEWQGRSLVRLVDDPQPPPSLVVSHLGDGSRAAIVGTSKMILGAGRGPGAQHFFDLAKDPGETAPAEERGVAFRVVRTALGWQLEDEERWKRSRWGTGAALEPAFALDHGM